MRVKKFLNLVFSRTVITFILILIQLFIMSLAIYLYASYDMKIYAFLSIFSFAITLHIVRTDENSAYKLTWTVLLLCFPVFGGLLYLYLSNKRPAKRMRKKMDEEYCLVKNLLCDDKHVIEKIEPDFKALAHYIEKFGGVPARENTYVKYFSCGEDVYPEIINELKKAKKYIYLEFFIISPGIFWDSVLGILKEKADKGVDVRLFYDDAGSMNTLPRKYVSILEKYKIKTICFNRFIPVVSVIMNHRDHRKMIIIDGKTAFTGGFNLADEYINKVERFGYWKDSAVMVKGDGVLNFIALFAQMWNSFSEFKIDSGIYNGIPEEIAEKNKGFIQPFGDSPLDNEQVSENIYLEIINRAIDYVYIFTPYLVVDDQMKAALTLASKRGVDVRIVTPGIPDKKTVFRVTRSYYQTLISSGVKIYEFTPGFLHAKSIVSDDRAAVVGSVNMDFRSLYLHFECGVFMVSNKKGEIPAILSLKSDCFETFEKSHEIKKRESKHFSRSLFDALLRIIAPLI